MLFASTHQVMESLVRAGTQSCEFDRIIWWFRRSELIVVLVVAKMGIKGILVGLCLTFRLWKAKIDGYG